MARLNQHGLALIKSFEGLSLRAYRCSAGVWTIGYGHTSMAGDPRVATGQQISRGEADKILARDVDKFARDVASVVGTVDLNDNQFSALVCFAYNVGLGAFRGSSVLKAVRGQDFDAVPRRLNLWVKAAGRTLPGLVKRRSAEGALFAKDPRGMALFSQSVARPTEGEIEDMQMARGSLQQMTGTPIGQSTTVFATALASMAGVTGAIREAMWTFQDVQGFVPERFIPAIIMLVVVAACGGWVINERRKKAEDDGV